MMYGQPALPLEKELEKILVKEIDKLGGEAWKFTSPGRRGVPDRLVLIPSGIVFFVEMKRPDGKIRHAQARCHKELRRLGFPVRVIWDLPGIYDFVTEVKAHENFHASLNFSGSVGGVGDRPKSKRVRRSPRAKAKP